MTGLRFIATFKGRHEYPFQIEPVCTHFRNHGGGYQRVVRHHEPAGRAIYPDYRRWERGKRRTHHRVFSANVCRASDLVARYGGEVPLQLMVITHCLWPKKSTKHFMGWLCRTVPRQGAGPQSGCTRRNRFLLLQTIRCMIIASLSLPASPDH